MFGWHPVGSTDLSMTKALKLLHYTKELKPNVCFQMIWFITEKEHNKYHSTKMIYISFQNLVMKIIFVVVNFLKFSKALNNNKVQKKII